MCEENFFVFLIDEKLVCVRDIIIFFVFEIFFCERREKFVVFIEVNIDILSENLILIKLL